jgi:hypothetical protein
MCRADAIGITGKCLKVLSGQAPVSFRMLNDAMGQGPRGRQENDG